MPPSVNTLTVKMWAFLETKTLLIEPLADSPASLGLAHTTYSWNIMCQKYDGDCGLWILNEIVLKKYAKSLKTIVGAIWELPAK